jgi:predicted nucleic acid-binding protein
VSKRPFVIDASVLLPVLVPQAQHGDDALVVDALSDATLDVIAPPLIDLEVLNAAARRHRMPEFALLALVRDLEDVARWSGRGLSSYDATYAALAEELGAELLTNDAQIHEACPEHAIWTYAG